MLHLNLAAMASFSGVPLWFRELCLEHCPWVASADYMSSSSPHRFIDLYEMFSGCQHLGLACEAAT